MCFSIVEEISTGDIFCKLRFRWVDYNCLLSLTLEVGVPDPVFNVSNHFSSHLELTAVEAFRTSEISPWLSKSNSSKKSEAST